MTDALPAPLVPPEVDLRGLDYMPFRGHHLFGSDFNSRCNDAEWRAGVTLWWAAWNQVPAGSLPDDDNALAKLADLGRDLKTWKKLRANALHGFDKCSDGRLYHSFLAEQVLIAWDKRVKERQRKANWRANKGRGQDVDETRTDIGTGRGTRQGRDGSVPADGTLRDGTLKPSGSITTGGNATTPPVDNSENQTRKKINGDDFTLIPDWWKSNENIELQGKHLGMQANPGELHGPYRARIFDEIERRKREGT